MARTNARVVFNRSALNALNGVFVDGMEAFGERLISETKPPDATPFGQGLVTSGGWGVWAGSRKVAGGAQKPRSARLDKGAVTLLAGWSFPGRFQEIGTIRQPARPFFSPVIDRVAPGVGRIFQRAFRAASRRFR